MNLDKAIKLQALYLETRLVPNYHDHIEAIQLGREALIGVKTIRSGHQYDFTKPLPGETID